MWKCIHCDEAIEDSFAVCWNCGADREGKRDKSFTPVAEDPSVPDPGPTVEQVTIVSRDTTFDSYGIQRIS